MALMVGCSGVGRGPSDDGLYGALPDKSFPLTPGDPIPSVTSDEAFAIIIGPNQIRGITASFEITDPDALSTSLLRAGQGQVQIDAIIQDDVSLDRFIELARLELDCLNKFGLATAPLTVETDSFGLSTPTYGVSLGASEFDDGQLAYIQSMCQNYYTGAYQWFYRARFGLSQEEETKFLVSAANRYVACVARSGAEIPFSKVSSDSLDQFFAWLATDETPGCGPFP
jgi:hypothetical protein